MPSGFGENAPAPRPSYVSVELLDSIGNTVGLIEQRLAPVLSEQSDSKAQPMPSGSEVVVRLGQLGVRLENILQRINL